MEIVLKFVVKEEYSDILKVLYNSLKKYGRFKYKKYESKNLYTLKFKYADRSARFSWRQQPESFVSLRIKKYIFQLENFEEAQALFMDTLHFIEYLNEAKEFHMNNDDFAFTVSDEHYGNVEEVAGDFCFVKPFKYNIGHYNFSQYRRPYYAKIISSDEIDLTFFDKLFFKNRVAKYSERYKYPAKRFCQVNKSAEDAEKVMKSLKIEKWEDLTDISVSPKTKISARKLNVIEVVPDSI